MHWLGVVTAALMLLDIISEMTPLYLVFLISFTALQTCGVDLNIDIQTDHLFMACQLFIFDELHMHTLHIHSFKPLIKLVWLCEHSLACEPVQSCINLAPDLVTVRS